MAQQAQFTGKTFNLGGLVIREIEVAPYAHYSVKALREEADRLDHFHRYADAAYVRRLAWQRETEQARAALGLR